MLILSPTYLSAKSHSRTVSVAERQPLASAPRGQVLAIDIRCLAMCSPGWRIYGAEEGVSPEARTGHLSVTVQQDGGGEQELPTKTSEMLFRAPQLSLNPLKQQSPNSLTPGPSFMEVFHGSGREGVVSGCFKRITFIVHFISNLIPPAAV